MFRNTFQQREQHKRTNLCPLANDHLPDWILLVFTQFSQWGQVMSLQSIEIVHSLFTNVKSFQEYGHFLNCSW